MKEKERAIQKDKMLRIMGNSQVVHTSELANQLNIGHPIVLVIVDEIEKEELIIKRAISTTVPEGVEFVVKITPKGLVFLNNDTGFVGRFKKDKKSHIWGSTKTIAIVANAIIILLLTIWGIKSNNDKTDYKNELFKKDSTILKLKLRIDSLVSDSLKKH